VELAPAPLIEAVGGLCPGLDHVGGGLSLVLHLLLTETTEPPGRTAPCPYRLLCEIEGASASQVEHGNARANEFLERVQETLAGEGPLSLEVTEHKYHEGEARRNRARRLRLVGVPAEVEALAERARSTISLDSMEWRLLEPGGTYALNGAAMARRTQDLLATLPQYEDTPGLSRSLIGYLNELDPRTFT